MATWPNNAAKPITNLDADGDTVTGTGGGRDQLDTVSQAVNDILAAVATNATVWSDDNHGSGSGLDADKLDNLHAASFGRYATVGGWTAQQYFTQAVVTRAATVNWNLSTQQGGLLTLNGNVTTFAAPTNQKAGSVYILMVKNTGAFTISATGWNAVFKWPGGTAPATTQGSGKVDILTFISDGSSMYGVNVEDFS
jgi:hypothetical protein